MEEHQELPSESAEAMDQDQDTAEAQLEQVPEEEKEASPAPPTEGQNDHVIYFIKAQTSSQFLKINHKSIYKFNYTFTYIFYNN